MSHRDTFVVSGLCCDKSHRSTDDCAYRVSWAINPHMRVGEVDFDVAARQHGALCRALTNAGAEVIELPFVHSAFDSVFSKDNAVLQARNGSRRALMTRPLHDERALEQKARAATYARLGFDVVASLRHHLEGGDVAVTRTGAALMGYGQRSSVKAADELERFLDAEVTPLELVDPYFFHLDVALSFLADGTLLLYPDAFTRDALQTIERVEGVTRIVPISREGALKFGLNMVDVGDTIILGGHVAEVELALLRGGFKTQIVPLSQFHLSGGSAACLTAKVCVPTRHSSDATSAGPCRN